MMDSWKRDALVNQENDLKKHLGLTEVMSLLEKPAGGFMTDVERMSVDEEKGRIAQVDKILKILRSKGNEEFDIFLEILRKSGNGVWADCLATTAFKFQQEYAVPQASNCDGELTESVKGGRTLRKRPSTSKEVEDLEAMEEGDVRKVRHLEPRSGRCRYYSCKSVIVMVFLCFAGTAALGFFPCCHPGNSPSTLLQYFVCKSMSWNLAWEERDASATDRDIHEEDAKPPKHERTINPLGKEKWPLLTNHTVKLKAMPCELQVISSIIHDNKVYITGMGIAKDKGGEDIPKNDVSRQIQVYPLDGVGNWSTLPEDPQNPAPNYNAPITIINGHITLVGGRDADTGKITNISSAWNEEKREWEHDNPPPMLSKRLASGVCHHDDYLLVVGGVVDDKLRRLVNTVDVYDFSSKLWKTPKALDLPIHQLRSPHVVVFKEYVYVFGGATTYPTIPESGEAQYNPHAWRARWSDVKEAVSEAEVAVKQGAQTRAAAEEHSKEVKSVWRGIGNPPVLRPTVVSSKDSLLLVGGIKDGIPQNGIYKDVDGWGSWKLVGNMSVGRYLHAVVPLGSHGTTLFIAGGSVLSCPDGIERHKESSSAELLIL